MKLTDKFYIISDTHFEHKNIIAYEARPEDYAEKIVKNWNQAVKKKDNVFFLGDLALCNKELAKKWIKQLQGNKFMLRGNHDKNGEQWYQDLGFTTVEPVFKQFDSLKVLFTHEPLEDLPEDWFNIHGHIHLGVHRKPKLTGRHFNVSVEVINYTPIQLIKILKHFGQYKHKLIGG